jgi:hypothetical protein
MRFHLSPRHTPQFPRSFSRKFVTLIALMLVVDQMRHCSQVKENSSCLSAPSRTARC